MRVSNKKCSHCVHVWLMTRSPRWKQLKIQHQWYVIQRSTATEPKQTGQLLQYQHTLNVLYTHPLMTQAPCVCLGGGGILIKVTCHNSVSFFSLSLSLFVCV